MVSGGSFVLLALGIVVALVIHAALYGPQAALITEQFSPRLRYTGSSLAYTLAGVIGGAPAPLILAALLNWLGSWWVLAAYLLLTAVLTVVGLWLARDPAADDEVTAPVREEEVLS
jgi:MFS family permease